MDTSVPSGLMHFTLNSLEAIMENFYFCSMRIWKYQKVSITLKRGYILNKAKTISSKKDLFLIMLCQRIPIKLKKILKLVLQYR